MCNSLVQTLSLKKEMAQLDAACKAVLSDKHLLAHILKTVAKEYRGYSIEEIVGFIEGEPEIGSSSPDPSDENVRCERVSGMSQEDSSVYEGVIRYDIRFRSVVPNAEGVNELIVNVEAQNDFRPGYSLVTRGIYYCARMISSQKETEFHASHYEKIKKVYSIWICINPTKAWKETITKYRISEQNLVGNAHESEENYDKIDVSLVCLGNEQSSEKLIKMLSIALSNTMDGEQKIRNLTDMGLKMTRTSERGMWEMCNYSKGILEKGLTEGHEKGLTEGLKKGKLDAYVDAVKKLTASGFELLKAIETIVPEEYKDGVLAKLKADDDRYAQG